MNKRSGFKLALTRAERNLIVRKRLFDAAAKVVGEVGYAEASIARITRLAGVSQGTFYTHFANRQQLLDELLPVIGAEMLDHIVAETPRETIAADKEVARFLAFFSFLKKVPEFLRILNEAELFAPAGHKKHMDTIAQAYARSLMRARDRGELKAFTDEEMEAVSHILLGARSYLSRVYAYDAKHQVNDLPDHVRTAYAKLLAGGLFPTDTRKQDVDGERATAPRLEAAPVSQ